VNTLPITGEKISIAPALSGLRVTYDVK